MSKRQQEDFHKPHLIAERLLSPLALKKPARILMNFMGDLGGNWVDPEQPIGKGSFSMNHKTHHGWILNADVPIKRAIFEVIEQCPQHTFIFLTKNPARLVEWSPFPDNAWVGATVCSEVMYIKALKELQKVDARVKWLSIEPFYERLPSSPELLEWAGIRWVVIGAQSNPIKYPEIEWVQEFLVTCHNAGICPEATPKGGIWMKNNLIPLLDEKWPSWTLLQEMPVV